MLRFHRWKIAIAFFAMGCSGLFANPLPVAYVKTVTGDAWVHTSGQMVKATLGTAIFKGSLLKTSTASSLGITFTDNTVMSFGSNTELTVDEYLYTPSQNQLGLNVSLAKGTLNYVSGIIAKLKPESVKVKTTTGIIGVRGTQFVAQVEPVEHVEPVKSVEAQVGE